MKNPKKAYILLTTSIIVMFIMLSIGAYIKYSTTVVSKEFHKDLAKIRGYWAVYGAKELETDVGYPYYRLGSSDFLYDVNATRIVTTNGWPLYWITDVNCSWSITNATNSGIKDDMVFKRVLSIYVDAFGNTDNNKTLSYKK